MPRSSPALVLSLLLLAHAVRAGVVLSVDVNDSVDSPADTAPGFASYSLPDETLTVPPFTVDINPASGSNLDDVHRTTPLTTGTLTLGALYRDCIFASDNNTSNANYYRTGIDTVIGGLTPGKQYTITAWSYDSGATGARVSDWSVLGLGGPKFAVNDYTFNGATAPANDAANRLSVTAFADAGGTLTLRGRPATQTAAAQVFLNGFTVDELAAAPQVATAVLALDFGERGGAGSTDTQAGFQEFLLTDAGSGPQSTAAARVYGSNTVTLTPSGGSVDDRVRSTPTNSGSFTDSLLLRDFIFGTNGAGMDVRIQGLAANQTYMVELWSFDSGSAAFRASDWTVNGAMLWDDYPFNGANLPVTNNDYKMAGSFTSTAGGELLISGRAASGTGAIVFLNALRISTLGAPAGVNLGRPIISEFLAENSSGIVDEDGDTSDWIEIWNTTTGTLNLAGWHLTDDPLTHTKWTFPAGTTLASQARLRVWASGKDRKTNPAALHTNFALSKTAGSYLALFQPGGTTAATEFSALPTQRANISYGLAGTADPLTAGYFSPPTPGAANGTPVPGFVSDTVFDVDRGFFTAPFSVHITCATPGAAIRYTTDGSTPTASSAVYPGAAGIPITTTTVLRAKAFAPPLAPSDADTQTYIFNAQVKNQPAAPAGWPITWGTDSEVASNNGGNGTVPADYEMDPAVTGSTLPGYDITDALGALPSLSVVMEPGDFHSAGSGIYTHPTSTGDTWERACSIEWIDPAGDNFHTDCGIRVHGNSSRRPYRMQKHSFRLAFRSSYGDGKLDFKLFDDTTVKQFDKLVLHAFFTDGWGLVSWDAARYRPDDSISFRDAFMKTCFADMGHARISSRFAHLYINGLYWGVYDVGERLDDEWCSEHLGGLPTDWDVIAPGESVYVRNGSGTTWDSLFAFINSADLTQQANYETVAAQVDFVDFVDYYLLHVHADSEDWPHHNGYAVRNHSVAGSRWRFIAWDQEISFDPTLNVDRLSPGATNTGVDKTMGRLYQKLRVNPEFRLLFADRAHKQLHNGGALSLPVEQARWQSFVNKLDKAIVAESARWGDTADATPYGNAVPAGKVYKRETNWLPTVQNVKNVHFPNLHNTANSYATITELRAQSLYPTTEPPAFGQFGGTVPTNYALTITAPAGAIYYTLDGSDPRTAYTGAVHGTSYSGPLTLTQTGTVKSRALNGGVWSALTEATFVVGEAASSTSLAVTELNYNPIVADEEFIELMNYSAQTIDLTGVHFEGITFTFSPGTLLAAGERIVVVRDPAVFQARYGAGPRVAGQYTGSLDNTGEEIAVIALDGSDIVRFIYNDKAPWPTAADGEGRSLVLRTPGIDPADEANWRDSVAEGGNPGSGDSLQPFSGNALTDADGDGFNALMEHALNGSDANATDVRPICSVETLTLNNVAAQYLTITAPIRLGADDIVVSGEYATAPGAWGPAVFVGEKVAVDGTASRKWRAPVAFTATPQQFLRVKVVKAH